IGVNPQKVAVINILKYGVLQTVRAVDVNLGVFLANWQQTWIAASTMAGEEELILEAFTDVRNIHSNLKLVIAPRHPERFDAIHELVRGSAFTVIRRTEERTFPDPDLDP